MSNQQLKKPYIPPPSVGHEIGVMFGFIGTSPIAFKASLNPGNFMVTIDSIHAALHDRLRLHMADGE